MWMCLGRLRMVWKRRMEHQKAKRVKRQMRDFVTLSIKHSVLHTPKMLDNWDLQITQHASTLKEPRVKCVETATLPKSGSINIELSNNRGKFWHVQKTLHSWWEKKVACPVTQIEDCVKHISVNTIRMPTTWRLGRGEQRKITDEKGNNTENLKAEQQTDRRSKWMWNCDQKVGPRQIDHNQSSCQCSDWHDRCTPKKDICMKCMPCVVGCDLLWSSSSGACETWWHGFPQIVFSESCQDSCFDICSQQPLLKAVRAEGLRSAKANGWTRKKHFDEAESDWSRQTLLSPKVIHL